jgi:hypothetical protein
LYGLGGKNAAIKTEAQRASALDDVKKRKK